MNIRNATRAAMFGKGFEVREGNAVFFFPDKKKLGDGA